jgi:hypothetical protein
MNPARLVITMGLSCLVVTLMAACREGSIDPKDVLARASGAGSTPAMLLRDGTVCLTAGEGSVRCDKLTTLPADVVRKVTRYHGTFYGVFDADNDGDPEVFLDYWPTSSDADCPNDYRDDPARPESNCGAVTLLVYKRSGSAYRERMKLNAPSMGYSPGAWFFRESPVNKVLFSTRCGGSCGDCLFYLDSGQRALKEIGEGCLQAEPTLEDADHDGVAEIFLQSRGYDRTAAQGAGLFHWKDGGYQQWWPKWPSPPYVIYAQMQDLDGDREKEIVAILDPAGESARRELGIWKLGQGEWKLADKVKLPEAGDAMPLPTFSRIAADSHGTEIALDYPDRTVRCRYQNQKIACSKDVPEGAGRTAKPKPGP